MNSRALLCLTLVGFAGLARAGTPALPNIPAYTTDVTQAPYNALGDGTTINTTAIQTAINDVNARGGGTVAIPGPGVYLSGPLTLKNNLNLQIDAGAVLRMLPLGQYPGGTVNPANFISGSGLHDIAISGPGAIDGQGAPWWPYADTNGANRPRMIALSKCNRQLIQNITLSNSPMFHIAISGASGNTTVQGVIIRAPSSGANPPSHNTDACDVSGTNILVQNCDISVGDDNFTCGGSTSDILLTNNTYGYGHGVSIGSYTSPYVSNMTVVNCTFNNTDQGIRIKSDRDRGGFVHNINYYNLSMTNVMQPILIYCQYTNTTSAYRALDRISPGVAASYPSAPVTGTTPTYCDITISNVTATAQSGRAAGLIWGLPEMSISNVTLIKVNLTGSKTFGIYDAKNVKLIDCANNVTNSVSQFSFYDSQVIFSNSTPPANTVTLDGCSTNGIGNTLLFYNSRAAFQNTNAIAGSPGLTLGSSTLAISNNLNLDLPSVVNFVLGTNTTTMTVASNLILGGTVNISAGSGFASGSYTLFTYGRKLTWGPPTLGGTPAGYTCAFDTNTTGKVNLLVSSSPPMITKQPSSQVVLAGSDVLFTVGVAGSVPLSYQWWLNGTNRLAAGTNISLTISNATPTNAGSYSVVVTNALGAAVSSNALLAILEPKAWGDNTWNQLDVPAQALDVIAIGAGAWHNLVLRADGRVLAWGNDSSGQCDVPATLPGALAIAGGGYHSLALRADGTVVAWGANDYAQTNVPAGLANVIGISAGTWHSLALCRDGTVAAWGDNSWGQSSVPAGLSNVVAIAAGGNHSLALQTNGMVVAWGENTDAEGNYIGQSRVPANVADVVAIGAGEYHSMAVRSDRTVVAWGDNSAGQSTVPAGLSNVVAVAGGGAHSVALTADGAVAAWGDNWNGQCNMPTGLSDVVGIGAGEDHSVALLAATLPVPQLLSPARQGRGFSMLVQTLNRKNYALEFKSPITATNWSAITTNPGNGALRQLSDPAAPPSLRFYRAVYLP